MRRFSGIAALAGALVVLCGVVAWEWYVHVGGKNGVPQPVQQIAAASSAPAASAATSAPAPAPAASAAATGAPSTSAPAATPTPVVYVPQPSPSASAAPAAAPTPAPTATPYSGQAKAVRSEPLVAATLAPHVVSVKNISEPPDAPPRILSMSLSTPVAHGGQVVSGTVQTSSNVASVEARIGGYSSSLQKVGVGTFTMSYRVPNLPFFLHRTYNIEVIARNTRGDEVRSSVPITIR